MDSFGEEYKLYWETNMFLQNEELDSWGLDEALSAYYDSSSPDGGGASTSPASKNIVSERNRRKKLNERLFALRGVVPKISKMDKASIIKDAIEYIQELIEEERRIQSEISELESGTTNSNINFGFNSQQRINNAFSSPSHALLRSKKKKTASSDQLHRHHYRPRASPVEDIELRISHMGERTVVVSLSCSKRADTMMRLCEVFESLNLKVVTANMTAFAGRLLKTALVEVGVEGFDNLKMKVEAAIATINDPPLSPMSV